MRGAALLAAALVPAVGGCGEAWRPVPGGLEVGDRGRTFRMPVMVDSAFPFRYPAGALREGIGGEAIVRLHITAAGRVDSVELDRSSGHPGLDSAAVAGARRLRYRPARRGTERVDVWATLPVRFPMPESQEHP